METVLEVANVSVSLAGESVLEDVSFALRRGEMTAVIGPNGSGKTTLFRALLGLVPHAGTVRWHPAVAIGYVPQRFSVAADAPVTVEEFFLLKSARFWMPERGFLDHLSHELGLVGLTREVLPRPLGSLSSGQLQRLLVAWAMLHHPEVLLFDEPTSAIDVGFEETIYEVMHRLTVERHTAVLFISHDLHIVSRHVDNVLCVNRRLLCQGPPAEVLTPEQLGRLFGEVAYYPHQHASGHGRAP